jgi:hypothetical protein
MDVQTTRWKSNSPADQRQNDPLKIAGLYHDPELGILMIKSNGKLELPGIVINKSHDSRVGFDELEMEINTLTDWLKKEIRSAFTIKNTIALFNYQRKKETIKVFYLTLKTSSAERIKHSLGTSFVFIPISEIADNPAISRSYRKIIAYFLSNQKKIEKSARFMHVPIINI